jgi:Domain of unknown function (DUF4412)
VTDRERARKPTGTFRAMLPRMKTPRPVRLALVTLTAGTTLLAGGLAHAGVTLTFQRGTTEPQTLYIEKDRVRVENPGKDRSTVIIDAAGKRIVMVDDAEKSWSEMTEEDMRHFKEQLAGRKAQMEEHMKSLPPEQRKRFEDMLSPKEHELTFEKMGAKKSVNGFACEMYRVLEDGKPREEDCVAPWGPKVLQKSDFAGLQKFAAEMAKNMGGMGGGRMFERFEKYPGFPVSQHPLQPGQPDEELKSVKRGAIPADKFAVPAGYVKKDRKMGMQGPPPGPFRPMPPPKQ